MKDSLRGPRLTNWNADVLRNFPDRAVRKDEAERSAKDFNGFKNKLLLIDATTIELCASVFD